MSATYLHELAIDLLGAAASGLVTARTGNPEPDRVYVSHSLPAWDMNEVCSSDGQLTVHYGPENAVSLRPIGQRSCQVLPRAHLCVTLLRCVPTVEEGGAPHAASVYDDSAAALLSDGWSLLTHLLHEWSVGTLFPDQDCTRIDFGNLTGLGPEGGIGGWRICVDVDLNDPGPAEAS